MNPDTALLVCSFSSDRRVLACVCKSFHAACSAEDKVWLGGLIGDYQTDTKEAPVKDANGRYEMTSLPSFKEAWLAWRTMELEYEGDGEGRILYSELWSRSIRAWATIRRTLESMGTLHRVELKPGLRNAKNYLKRATATPCVQEDPRLQEAVRAVWGQHNGQNIARRPAALFGTTMIYEQTHGVLFLPLKEMLLASRDKNGMLVIGVGARSSGFAMYFDNRIMYMSTTGYLEVSRKTDDVIIDLFEVFAQDLEVNGRTEAIPYALSTFPQQGPRTCSAITQNIRVRGAYTLLPAMSSSDETLMWVYEFRIDLIDSSHPEYLPEKDRVWKNKAVLLTRHWTFVDPVKAHPQIVEGEGVVGFMPCLDERTMKYRDYPDSTEWSAFPFAYRSCTYASPGSYMEGFLTFAPELHDGTIEINRSFRVNVGRLRFKLPKYPV